MWLTRLAVVRPLTVLMGLLGLVIMGGVSYTFLKIDRLPPISIPFVSVSMAYTGRDRTGCRAPHYRAHRKCRLGHVRCVQPHLDVQ